MDAQIMVRVDPALKNKVMLSAKAEGKNVSEVIRSLLEDYVKNRDIGAYIDDLWNRIGTKIQKQNISQEDIDTVIRQVRAEEA